MKKILLVEDDGGLGQTLTERLRKESYEVVWVKDLASARRQSATDFHLIVLDVGLPDGSGFDFAREVRGTCSVPFIFVTAQGDAEMRLTGYEIGAEEYIPKPFHLKELLLRVKHVLQSHAAENWLKFGDVKIDFSAFRIERNDEHIDVPARDMQLLQLLINESPRVVSRDEVLESLWGEDQFPSNRTIDNAILRLRQILGDQVGPCIQSVRGVGYRWSKE